MPRDSQYCQVCGERLSRQTRFCSSCRSHQRETMPLPEQMDTLPMDLARFQTGLSRES